MRSLLVIFLLSFSLNSHSGEDDDQFGCEALYNGKIIDPLGYQASIQRPIHKMSDYYEFKPSPENPYGGITLIWIIQKDELGRIVKIESGDERPSPKIIQFETKKFKQRQANDLSINISGIVSSSAIHKAFKTTPPLDFEFKFGAIIDIAYDGKKCLIQKITDKHFKVKNRKVDGNHTATEVVFDRTQCTDSLNLKKTNEPKDEYRFSPIINNYELINSFSIFDYLVKSSMGFKEGIISRKEDFCYMLKAKQ